MNCVIDGLSLNLSVKTLKQMIFISNALENGWSVKKLGKNYHFTHRLSQQREVYEADFLDKFVAENANMDTFRDMLNREEEERE
jgi:hypothetical protein